MVGLFDSRELSKRANVMDRNRFPENLHAYLASAAIPFYGQKAGFCPSSASISNWTANPERRLFAGLLDMSISVTAGIAAVHSLPSWIIQSILGNLERSRAIQTNSIDAAAIPGGAVGTASAICREPSAVGCGLHSDSIHMANHRMPFARTGTVLPSFKAGWRHQCNLPAMGAGFWLSLIGAHILIIPHFGWSGTVDKVPST